ncbi:MAG: helix-hairpin-helix domain-containing protein [Thermodesulfobacteriota bacterium]|nr:helix-hairpin-helix domain-containing protein [Thermodesulfobacteriota bacterium]
MRVFCTGQQIVLLAIALTAVAVNLQGPLPWLFVHQPVAHSQPQPQWAVEITGPVASPGIYSFDKPPSLSQALREAGPIRTPHLSSHMASRQRLPSGTALRPITDRDGSWRIISSSMDAKKMLVLGIPFDVNEAAAEDLALVPGMGHRLARRIVASRDSRGPFTTWDDLRKVKGVGPMKIEMFRKYFHTTQNTPSCQDQGASPEPKKKAQYHPALGL